MTDIKTQERLSYETMMSTVYGHLDTTQQLKLRQSMIMAERDFAEAIEENPRLAYQTLISVATKMAFCYERGMKIIIPDLELTAFSNDFILSHLIKAATLGADLGVDFGRRLEEHKRLQDYLLSVLDNAFMVWFYLKILVVQ